MSFDQLKRREFIALLGSAAAWPFAARAQQPSPIPLIGFLSAATREGFAPYVAAFHQGLREIGFVEGRNVAVEYQFAEDHFDRLPALAANLIQRPVAVMAADARAIQVAKNLTTTVPIVFMSGSDPVRTGLVASLDRPGGNLTGVTILASDLTAKRFSLLHDLVPRAPTIGVLSDTTSPRADFVVQEVRAAAQRLGVSIRVIGAGTESELEAAFATLAQEGVSAVFINNGFFFFSFGERIAALAARHRLPSSGELRNFVEGGGLMSYGPSLADAFRQVGRYAGRILKGEKAADLPVMQPTKFDFLINLKTARAIGFTIPPAVLAIADEVIE
jgi:putative ABC transport system substrate-binding protein